jgi:hypothetical protein
MARGFEVPDNSQSALNNKILAGKGLDDDLVTVINSLGFSVDKCILWVSDFALCFSDVSNFDYSEGGGRGLSMQVPCDVNCLSAI